MYDYCMECKTVKRFEPFCESCNYHWSKVTYSYDDLAEIVEKEYSQQTGQELHCGVLSRCLRNLLQLKGVL